MHSTMRTYDWNDYNNLLIIFFSLVYNSQLGAERTKSNKKRNILLLTWRNIFFFNCSKFFVHLRQFLHGRIRYVRWKNHSHVTPLKQLNCFCPNLFIFILYTIYLEISFLEIKSINTILFMISQYWWINYYYVIIANDLYFK